MGKNNLKYIEIKNAGHNFEKDVDRVILEIENFLHSK
jgi:hypothetical protein